MPYSLWARLGEEEATHAVIETPDYLSDAKAAGMNDSEREAVIMISRPIPAQAWKSPALGEHGKSVSRDVARERVAGIG